MALDASMVFYWGKGITFLLNPSFTKILSLDRKNIPLGPQTRVLSTYYVQGPNHTRLRYIAQGIPMQNHAWFFEALFMDLDASMVYLGTNTWHCSLKCHSQGHLTPTQCS